jgi:tRNA A-37 threonylcarbamoyl transferase component Bud32
VSDAQRVVGRYEILREIGRGGMASVHLARQADLDRLVALKELRALGLDDPSLARRFLLEARVSGSISHPNIVTVHDYFEDDGIPYIAMEYLARGSLRPYVGRLSPSQIGRVLEGLLGGLAEAERHRIVHRDIKPENLLVTDDGGVKIADFGIAKATNVIQETGFLTATGMTVGTPNYIAPEQAMARELGPWTDLYSVGITAFELVAGRTPFADTKEAMAIVLRQINEPIPPVTEAVPNVDQSVARWIAWLVAKDPARRPQSAREAWDAFEDVLIRLLGPRWRSGAYVRAPVAAPPPTRGQPAADPRLAVTAAPRRPRAEAPPPAVAPRRRRRRPPFARVGALVAVLAVGGALLGGRGGSPGSVPVAPAVQDVAVVSTPAAQTTTSSTAPLAGNAAQAQKLAATYRTRERAAGASASQRAADRATADAYDRAASAATRGDVAGYNAALVEASVQSRAVTNTRPTAVATSPAPSAPAPVTQSGGNCAGDSTSDDPSDDECSP